MRLQQPVKTEEQINKYVEVGRIKKEPPKKLPKIEPPFFGEQVKGIAGHFGETNNLKLLELQGKTLAKEVDNIEEIHTINGVDFSRIQINKILADLIAGRKIEFETFSPYLSDYNLKTGEIWKDKLIPADKIGLALAKTFRELFPNARLVSLHDEYNTGMPDSSNPRGIPVEGGKQLVLPQEVKDRFEANIVQLLKENGSISPDGVAGKEYLMISESSKQDDAVKLVERLKEKGFIKQKGEMIAFVNKNAENPLFQYIPLRTKNGRWLCEALDASTYIKPENLAITHIVALPNHFKNQQDKVWEMLRVLGIKPENYHNIFYHESADPQVVVQTIKDEFEKAGISNKDN